MIARGHLVIWKLAILLGLLSGPAFADGVIEDRVTVVRDVDTIIVKIGGRETAYLADLMARQQAALVELETDRMVLFVAGNLFDCARESQP